MKPRSHTWFGSLASVFWLLGFAQALAAQEAARFEGIQMLTNREVRLKLRAPSGLNFRIDASANLLDWNSLITLRSTGLNEHTDLAPPNFAARFYRALQVSDSNALTGDHLATADGEVVFHPINHATFVMRWNGKMIYNDPVGGASLFQSFPRADLILVSHSHGDHFNAATIEAVRGPNTTIIAPQAVYNGLSSALRSLTVVMANGARTNLLGLGIEAVPAYNLTTSNHLKGQGNGYVLTVGGKRIYMSGDTEDIPEMRALQGIDVAFVCMNIPFTMSVDKASSAVRDFRPKVIYPYHFRNQDSSMADLSRFKQRVGTDLDIEVRVRTWY
ncbi:MAG: MBL fold metallo-hydrolase [Verrucomicrobia bacterium]|nr:MBL fold metallo-hydrolase [Verrucomicrobiota bacterium]